MVTSLGSLVTVPDLQAMALMRRPAARAAGAGLACCCAALALTLVARERSPHGGAVLADTEWAGGSERWAQSATPRDAPAADRWSWGPSDTTRASSSQDMDDRWSAFRSSQTFIPARLQGGSPPAEGREVGTGRRAGRRGSSSTPPSTQTSTQIAKRDAAQDAIEADAVSLIKKADERNAEAIMQDEAASLKPLWFQQSGEQRSLRAWVAAQARAAREEEERAAAARATAAREAGLEAQGFVPKGGDDDIAMSAQEEPAEAEEGGSRVESMRKSYKEQGFSPVIGSEFAGSRGADWGGMDPVGFQPVQYMGYPMEPGQRAKELERTAAAAAAAALARGSQRSFSEQGFVPKEDTWGQLEVPADPAAAAFASSAQWARSRRAQTEAAAEGRTAVREMPFHSQGFPHWERDANLGWGDDVVGYGPPDRRITSQAAADADEAAWQRRAYLQEGFEPKVAGQE